MSAEGVAVSDAGVGAKLSSFLRNPFVILIVLGLAIRLILAPLLTANYDMTYWSRIINMGDSGLTLYDIEGYHYTPPWGFFLSFVGFIGSLLGITNLGTRISELSSAMNYDTVYSDIVTSMEFALLVKVSLIIVDVAVAYVLYRFVKDAFGDERKALTVSAIWFLSPMTIVQSAVHGMFDNLAVLMLVICLMMAHKRRYGLAGASLMLAILTKFFAIFLIPLIIAWVLRRDGFTRSGAKSLGIAVLGALICFALVEGPFLLTGDLWNSLYFITMRLDVTADQMAAIFTPTLLAILVIAIVAVIAIAWRWCVRNPDRLNSLVATLSTDAAEKKVIKGALALAVLALMFVMAFGILTAEWSGLTGAVVFLGGKLVTLLNIYAVIIELFLAYELLFRGEADRKRVTMFFMLGSMAVFLWPPLPQYPIFVLPFVAVYAAFYMPKLIKPIFLMGLMFALYDFAASGITVLYTLSMETGWISMDTMVSLTEAFYAFNGELNIATVVSSVFRFVAFLSLIYIIYVWYRESRGKGVLSPRGA